MRLLTDLPVDRKGDGLGFVDYGKALAEAIVATKGPLTVGVYGEWGSGKSSLLGMIMEHLKPKRKRVATVWFNAWQYEKESHPVVPLIKVMIDAIEQQQAFHDRLKEGGVDLVAAFTSMAAGLAMGSRKGDEPLTSEEAKLTSKELVEGNFEALLDRSVYFNAYKRLEGVKLPAQTKVVVFVDDLDRCFPDKAIALLESIKLVLSHQGFAFVLGVDRQVLEGYLDHRYRVEYGLADFSGSSYLDKIVQLPFYIPSHERRIQQFSEKLLSGIGLGSDHELRPVLEVLVAACRSNPRATVRMVNNLVVDQGISRAMHGEADAVPIGLFAVTRALQQRWGGVYGALVTSDSLCGEVLTWAPPSPGGEPEWPSPPESTGAGSGDGGDTARDDVLTELRRDGDLVKLLFSESGRRWLREAETRTAATSFIKEVRREEQSSAQRQHVDVCFSGDVDLSTFFGKALEDSGLSYLVIEFIGVESDNRELEDILRSARVFVPMLTEDLLGPRGVPVAWQTAEKMSRRKGGLRVLPVLIDHDSKEIFARFDAEGRDVPEVLRLHQPLDISRRSKEEGAKELLRAVRSMIG